MVTPPLRDRLAARILLLDGAMGTMLQQRRLGEAEVRGPRFRDHPSALAGNLDLFALTQPAIVSDIHHAYLAAGADIIATNTFGGTAIAQAAYGLEAAAYEISVCAARLARAAADDWSRRTPDHPRFVAGTMGPTSRELSGAGQGAASRAAAAAIRLAYREQARALIDGGVDVLLLETIFDAATATAAIDAVLEESAASPGAPPLMVAVTVSREGRLRSGQRLDAFYESIRYARPLCVGVNCSNGARDIRRHVETLAAVVETGVMAYPSAGLPNEAGYYPEGPEETAAILRGCAESGLLNVAGGCCGTTPAHIAALRAALDGLPPRPMPFRSKDGIPQVE